MERPSSNQPNPIEPDSLVRDKRLAEEMAYAENPHQIAAHAAEVRQEPEQAQEHRRESLIEANKARLRYEIGLSKNTQTYDQTYGAIEARRSSLEKTYAVDENERRELQRLAELDDLTGLANIRALNKALPTAEADSHTAVLVFDANNFGQVNKVAGQERGDEALKSMADALFRAASEYGIGTRVFRRGGDEFVILAPREIASELITKAENNYGIQTFGQGRKTVRVSITGIADKTFTQADARLQEAKKLAKEKQHKTYRWWRRPFKR